MRVLAVSCFLAMIDAMAASEAAAEVSVERGLYLSIVGNCHYCHTEGYRANNGVIDPEKALRGSSIGWQGPWGTTYSVNIRLAISGLSEDGFVRYAKVLNTNPPMPWYVIRLMQEDDLRSLYRYVKSLGEPGAAAPTFVGPGGKLSTAYVVLDPPKQPPACARDLDCGVGEICAIAEPRRCVPK